MRREHNPSIHSIEETRTDRTTESLHSCVHIVRGDFMQLKLQRTQRAGGAFGTVVIFCLDARAEYSPAEAANIGKYKLGGQSVYNSQAARKHLERVDAHLDRTQSGGTGERAIGLARGIASFALAKMHLNISIASLGRGHRIECKDLGELLEAESALMEACRNLREFLQVAASFNGSIILVDFDDGEKVHVSQGALALDARPAREPSGAPLHEEPSPEDELTPTDLAQMQAGSTEELLDVLFGGRFKQFRAGNPLAFWLCTFASVALLVVVLLHAVR